MRAAPASAGGCDPVRWGHNSPGRGPDPMNPARPLWPEQRLQGWPSCRDQSGQMSVVAAGATGRDESGLSLQGPGGGTCGRSHGAAPPLRCLGRPSWPLPTGPWGARKARGPWPEVGLGRVPPPAPGCGCLGCRSSSVSHQVSHEAPRGSRASGPTLCPRPPRDVCPVCRALGQTWMQVRQGRTAGTVPA